MKHTHLAETSSTNDEARRAFASGDALPFLISAEQQTAGRGRNNRPWSHAPGNFAGTFALPAEGPLASEPGALAFIAGLAVREALIAFGANAEALKLKWPNDVLLADCKVAGVLAEFAEEQGRRAFLLGIGVNLTTAPSATMFPAAAVFSASDAPDPLRFGTLLGERLLHWHSLADQTGPAVALEAWRVHAWRLGQPIRMRGETGAVEGLFKDIDGHGRMVLALANGEERVVTVGDASST